MHILQFLILLMNTKLSLFYVLPQSKSKCSCKFDQKGWKVTQYVQRFVDTRPSHSYVGLLQTVSMKLELQSCMECLCILLQITVEDKKSPAQSY